MTSLIGQLVTKTEVTSSPDIFFDIFAYKPYQLVNSAPDVYKSLDLLQGSWGVLGCVISVTYVDGGKTVTANAKVTVIDEVKKSVTFLIITGDLLSLYTTISATIQAGTQDGKNFVAWTMDYVKLLPITPDPTSLMAVVVAATKEIDAQNLI